MKLQKCDITLNEKDALCDILESEKQLMQLYTTALFEGSTQTIRKDFTRHLTSVAENQFCIYSQLSSRGYYAPPSAQKQMIDEICDTFKKERKQLSASH